ncbi:hypothetical protein M885DRAFT_67645 [Pelagophyceae sp. CCMP2097]|nr:hypothetical protein M885DRAFT_67645 [Pelagophyceae sp. CCMP2097]
MVRSHKYPTPNKFFGAMKKRYNGKLFADYVTAALLGRLDEADQVKIELNLNLWEDIESLLRVAQYIKPWIHNGVNGVWLGQQKACLKTFAWLRMTEEERYADLNDVLREKGKMPFDHAEWMLEARRLKNIKRLKWHIQMVRNQDPRGPQAGVRGLGLGLGRGECDYLERFCEERCLGNPESSRLSTASAKVGYVREEQVARRGGPRFARRRRGPEAAWIACGPPLRGSPKPCNVGVVLSRRRCCLKRLCSKWPSWQRLLQAGGRTRWNSRRNRARTKRPRRRRRRRRKRCACEGRR